MWAKWRGLGDLNWQGLDQWQQWALAIGSSLAAAFIIWLCTRPFGSRKGTDSAGAVQQKRASPAMTQNFQPIINIHPPAATSANIRVQETNPIVSRQELTDDPEVQRLLNHKSWEVPAKDAISFFIDGTPCSISRGTKSWNIVERAYNKLKKANH